MSINVSNQDITTNNITNDEKEPEKTVEPPRNNGKKLDEEATKEIPNNNILSTPDEKPSEESSAPIEPVNATGSTEQEEKTAEKPVENGNGNNTPEEALNEEKTSANNHKAESNSEASFSRDTSTERSESCIKEVPLSGDRNRFSRSKSPKARWHSDTAESSSETNQTENDQEHTKDESVKQASSTSDETDVVVSDSSRLEQQTEQTSETKATNETTTSLEGADAPKTQLRKRKWLTNDAVNVLSSKKPLTISSDTLKSYLPPSNSNTSNGDAIKKEEETSQVNGRKETELTLKPEETTSSTDSKQVTKQVSRTVIVEENNENIKETNDQIEEAPSEVELKKEAEASVKTEKSIPTSNVLHINNLTRPFTLPQLKELLSKYGPLKKIEPSNVKGEKASNEHYFWINSVKSHCYAAFEDLESAGRAYEGLHNTTWPQSNPKQLQVTYSTLDEISALLNSETSFSIPLSNASNNKLNKQQSINLSNDKENESVNIKSIKQEKVDSSTKKETPEVSLEHEAPHKTVQKVVREWDLPKYNNSDSRYYSSKSEEPSKTKSSSGETSHDKPEKSSSQKSSSSKSQSTTKAEEPPKTLDDLFRKTSAVPHIYWLPLTEEQFIEKQKESERRMIERMRRAEERQQKEAELTTTTTTTTTTKPNDDASSAVRYNKRKLDADQAEDDKSDDEQSRKTSVRNSNKNDNEDAKTTSSSNKNRRKSLSSEPPRRRERSESISS